MPRIDVYDARVACLCGNLRDIDDRHIVFFLMAHICFKFGICSRFFEHTLTYPGVSFKPSNFSQPHLGVTPFGEKVL